VTATAAYVGQYHPTLEYGEAVVESRDPRLLGQLLRSRRERLAPSDVGLPAHPGRRATGLRREEVAALASVSTTYYTFLEQGRPVRPSTEVLDALARALRMNEAERRYLSVLAQGVDVPALPARGGLASGPPDERVAPAVAALVERLGPCPTLVKGRYWDVLTINGSGCELFADFLARPPAERNLVRWMFTSERARTVYVDWEREAQAMLGRFRLAVAPHAGDPGLEELVRDLRRASPDIERLWGRQDVVAMGGGTKRLRHPERGPLEYTYVVLQVADHPDQTMVSYTPPPPPGR
jgi:transcriptional regulator with XRE-family HTH domain